MGDLKSQLHLIHMIFKPKFMLMSVCQSVSFFCNNSLWKRPNDLDTNLVSVLSEHLSENSIFSQSYMKNLFQSKIFYLCNCTSCNSCYQVKLTENLPHLLFPVKMVLRKGFFRKYIFIRHQPKQYENHRKNLHAEFTGCI